MEQIGKAANAASKTPSTISSNEFDKAIGLSMFHARQILGCYRTDEVSDPDTFISAVTSVLSRYPADVGARLSDPKDGIAGRIKWLPAISEIREACEALIQADLAKAKRKADMAEQFRLRDEFEAGGDKFPETNVDQCNILIRPDRPGYSQMIQAWSDKKIDHYRESSDGIHVNVNEYMRICGQRKIYGRT